MKRKKCTKCGRNRRTKFFYMRLNGKFHSWCETCTKEQKQAPMSKEQNRRYGLMYNYGITVEEYNILLKYQRYCCGACGRHRDEFNKNFAVDHDHSTGLIRGLLCIYCNRRVIGRLKLEWLEGAVTYLRDPPALRTIGKRTVPTKRRRRRRGRSS